MSFFKLHKISIFSVIAVLFGVFLSSCSLKNDYMRLALSDKIYYTVADSSVTYQDIRNSSDFKFMDYEKRTQMKKLVDNEDQFVWLRINFKLPSYLQYEDLGLFICQFNSACELWLNDYSLSGSGTMPPKPFSYGFGSHFYYFSKYVMRQEGINNLYLKVWPGLTGSISDFMFIGSQEDAISMSTFVSLVNSKLYVFFIGILIFNFLFYLGIFFFLRRFLANIDYLDFALLNLFTAGFMVPMCSSEFSTILPGLFSYVNFLRIFLVICSYAVVYFVSTFILHVLAVKLPKGIGLIRNFLALVCFASSFLIKDLNDVANFGSIFFFIILVLFGHSIVVLNIYLIRKETRAKAIGIVCGFAPVVSTIILDIFIKIILGYRFTPLFTAYGWIVTILTFTVQLIRRIHYLFKQNTAMQSELSDLNANLEEQIKQRTLELVSASEELNLTNKKLSQNIDILNYDLETAKIVQNGFMPPVQKAFVGWDVAVYYRPLEHVSGDMFDYYYNDNDLKGFSIFDVSGHGTSAALITMLSKTIIEHNFKGGTNKTTEEIMLNINKDIISVKSSTERYLTGLLMRFSKFDSNDKCYVELANAGHPFPILYSAEKQTYSEIQFADVRKQFGFIGLDDEQVAFPPSIFSMSNEDVLVFFTDGVPQTENSKGKYFGTQILGTSLITSKGKTAKRILDDIVDLLIHFAADKPISDDITIVVLKRTKSADFIEEI